MLAWMDLEMTGLDPSKHVIVEIATIVTDDDLNILAEGPDLVIHATEDQLGLMDDVVRKMHSESGLLDAITASSVSLEQAERATLDFLKSHMPDAKRVPLCGNSIGVDRRFLDRYMPNVEAHLHYRSVDVSSIKELCRRWCPPIYGRAPKKASAHRALDDIRESIAELAYYRDNFFVTKGSKPEATVTESSASTEQ
jgi:oligoribonuclease